MEIQELIEALNRRAQLKKIDDRTRELLILASHTIETMDIEKNDIMRKLIDVSRELGHLEGKLYDRIQ